MSMQLPVETWSAIIEFLPSSQQKNILSVSRSLHDIAVRFLFSTIDIYFIGGVPGFELLNSTYDQYAQQTENYKVSRSWELLNHITRDPAFAKLVKNISVHAFSPGGLIFEKLCLVQAIQSLPSLRSFRWSYSDLPADVGESLPSNLQVLDVPFTPPTSTLQHLTCLGQLRPFNPYSYENDYQDVRFGQGDFGELHDILRILEANSSTLRKLLLLGHHVGDLPIRVFSSLTDLEIYVPLRSELAGLDLIFRHAPCLKSLALLGFIKPDIFLTLKTNKSALPQLTSFRMSSEFISMPNVTLKQLAIVSEFFRGRNSMRRLCLSLGGCWEDISVTVVPAIGELKVLKVLGLHAGYQHLAYDNFMHLSQHLPSTLEALHLSLPWDSETMNGNTMEPLLDKLKTLLSLSFFHLDSSSSVGLPIQPGDLASEIEHLETIGLGDELWEVFREESTITVAQWARLKVKLCAVEDFRYEDDAWLFRRH